MLIFNNCLITGNFIILTNKLLIMNVKNFIVGGIVGGIIDWLLGWVFYGMLFKDTFPMEKGSMNMCMITCGCFAVGFFVSYLFNGLTSISDASTGLKAGAAIGLFQGLIAGFFENEATLTPNFKVLAIGTVISIVMVAAVGGAIGMVNEKMK